MLDDSLSAVDTKTESHILRALATRKGKQTTILIAHRLSTARLADRIFMLDKGRLVQEGTHDELLQVEGPYRRLWNIQGALEEEIERDLSGVAMRMSDADWLDDDHEEKVDLRLWKKLLQYTLHYRRTAVCFTLVAFGLAVTDLCFPLMTGKVIADVQENGANANLAALRVGRSPACRSRCASASGASSLARERFARM